MAEDIPNFGEEASTSVSATPENTKSLDYILRKYLFLTLTSFLASMFGKNICFHFFQKTRVFSCFWKAPNNSIDSDLKLCSKLDFYS